MAGAKEPSAPVDGAPETAENADYQRSEAAASLTSTPALGTGPVATIAKATPCCWTPRKPGHPRHKSCVSEGACIDRAYLVAVALRDAGYLVGSL